MHELGIASSILEAVETERQRYDGARVVRVGVRVGAWSGVDPAALRFSFEVLVADSELAPLALEIEACPRRNRCPACGHEFEVKDYEIECPACGTSPTQALGGDELELAFMEIEQP